jgi:hypothetical protein
MANVTVTERNKNENSYRVYVHFCLFYLFLGQWL